MTGSGIIGTPAYMSPEQAQGEPVDNRTDIYGLGVIIFQMLSGHQPYEATTPMGVAVKHITDPIPEILKVNPSLPSETDIIIKTAMAKDPSLRYQTATQLAEALTRAAFGERPVQQRSEARTVAPSTAAPAPRAGGGNRGLLIGGAVVLLLLLLGGAAVLFGGRMLAPAPTATAIPASPTAVVVTATLPPTDVPTATSAFAPVCAPGVIPEIAAPDVTEYQRFCNTKKAITVYTIPVGATYSVDKAGYKCDPYGQPGGKQLIACQGTNLTKFNLTVCIPQPTPSTSVVVGQCQPGNEYSYDHACCAPAKPADAGCKTIEVSLGACGGG
jgi:hypothetical protein